MKKNELDLAIRIKIERQSAIEQSLTSMISSMASLGLSDEKIGVIIEIVADLAPGILELPNIKQASYPAEDKEGV